MKKIALLLSTLAIGFGAQAQLTLSGTSYFQSFDNVGAGLPTGWEIDSNATATNKGTSILFNTTPTAWKQPVTTSGKGLNFAAKNGFTDPTTSAAIQAAATNRAMGLRQVGNIDSQIAFTLTIAQTTGLTNLNISFLLQSLDTTSPRISTWEVQYGIGSNPTSFTTVPATGTLTTGGSGVFSSNLITASFRSALNNMTGPVVIRIASLHKSSGAGNRASTAIDSLTLNWNGSGAPNYRPNVTAFSPANGATNVATNTSLMITFDRQITKGAGNIRVTNQTDHTQAQVIAASTAMVSGNTATIPGITLLNSKTYYVMFDSTAFDTAGFKSYGLYDSTSWKFTTAAGSVGTVSSLSESFDASCATGLPAGWQQQSVSGPAQTWKCSGPTTAPNYYVSMNGGGSTTSDENEDWLITPQLAATANMRLYFKTRYNFGGPNMQVLYSSNYSGTGSPTSASWTSLADPYAAADSNKWVTKSAQLVAGNIYIAFKYTSTQSTTSGNARRWDVDSVFTNTTTGIGSVSSNNSTIGVKVIGAATSSSISLAFDLEQSAPLQVGIYDLAGREVYRSAYNGIKGSNKLTLQPSSLQSGMYVIRVTNGKEQGIARTFVQ